MDKCIITISREFGTGGRKIANTLGELLGIKVYDRKLLEELKQRYNLTTEEMDRIKSVVKSTAHLMMEFADTGGFDNAASF